MYRNFLYAFPHDAKPFALFKALVPQETSREQLVRCQLALKLPGNEGNISWARQYAKFGVRKSEGFMWGLAKFESN